MCIHVIVYHICVCMCMYVYVLYVCVFEIGIYFLIKEHATRDASLGMKWSKTKWKVSRTKRLCWFWVSNTRL